MTGTPQGQPDTFLAVAPYAWARALTRYEAERDALDNVPRVYCPKPYLMAVFQISGPRAHESYVDGMGRMRVPEGCTTTELYRKEGC